MSILRKQWEATVVLLLLPIVHGAPDDPLASWNDGAAKRSIIAFVADVTNPASPHYVKQEDRIATFDQDGTLWVEQPLYTQATFMLDRIRALATQHPAWKQQQPFSAIFSSDHDAIQKLTKKDWGAILFASESGVTISDFHSLVKQWLASAKAPRFHRPFTDLVYQPMREMMEYLRDNGFRTYIVTGGDQEFVRPYSERVYGIPPEQVIGSGLTTKYTVQAGVPVLMRQPEVFFVNDRGGKPVGINLVIGRRPIAAFGNSAGDEEMLQWTQAGGPGHLEMLVYHDDGVREYAYGPAGGLPSNGIGAFPQSLMDHAKRCGWTIISMKRDWKRIFAWEK